MTRITRDGMLMGMARVVSQRSTCSRAQVGVIVAIKGRPLVSGYNGAPTGMPHCDHTCACNEMPREQLTWTWDEGGHQTTCPVVSPCTISVHAEANAIAFAAKNGVRLEGSSLFSTVQPCYTCCMLIINAGIVEVVYATSYRDPAGMLLLQNAGINAWMYLP